MRKNLQLSWILSICLMFLVGCTKEPMIKLSEENQKIVEQKQAKKSNSKNLKDKRNNNTTVDKSEWITYKEQPKLNMKDYMPFTINQIKTFTNGKEHQTSYLCYKEDKVSMAQRVILQQNSISSQTYKWDNNSYGYCDNNSNLFGFDKLNFNSKEKFQLFLQKKLEKGNQWKCGDRNAELSEVYQQIVLDKQVFKDVIQISIGSDQYYFAKNIGLIAEAKDKEFWYLQSQTDNVMLVTKINVTIPNVNQNTLVEKKDTEFRWQTNNNLAQALTFVFQNNNILAENQSIQNIKIEDDKVIVNFSEGVVASFNAHPQGEQAVLASVISTISDITQVKKVQLNVNNQIMIPWTFKNPQDGIYSSDETWYQQYVSPFISY